MFCIKCGVELSEGQKICPVCDTKVYHPDFYIPSDKDTYPKKEFKSEEFNRKGLMFAITFLMLIPLIFTVILELSWHKRIDWSGYVAGGILLFYICFILPLWFRRPSPAIFVPSAFIAATVYLLYICLQTSGKWFLGFGMPITLSLGCIVSAVFILLYYLKAGKLYIIGGGIIALGLWTALMELLIRLTFSVHTEFIWSICPMAVCFVFGMFLIIVEIVKPFKESLRKIFFVG